MPDYYATLSDSTLAEEAAHLERTLDKNLVSWYREHLTAALSRVRAEQDKRSAELSGRTHTSLLHDRAWMMNYLADPKRSHDNRIYWTTRLTAIDRELENRLRSRRIDPSEFKYIRTLSDEELQRRIDSPQTTNSFTPRRKEMYANELKRRAHHDKLRRRDLNMDYSDSTDMELENVLSGYKRRLRKAYDQKHFNWINARIEAVEKELECRRQKKITPHVPLHLLNTSTLRSMSGDYGRYLDGVGDPRDAFDASQGYGAVSKELKRRRDEHPNLYPGYSMAPYGQGVGKFTSSGDLAVKDTFVYPELSKLSYTFVCSPNGNGGGKATFSARQGGRISGEINHLLGQIDGLSVKITRYPNAATANFEFDIPAGQLDRFVKEIARKK